MEKDCSLCVFIHPRDFFFHLMYRFYRSTFYLLFQLQIHKVEKHIDSIAPFGFIILFFYQFINKIFFAKLKSTQEHFYLYNSLRHQRASLGTECRLHLLHQFKLSLLWLLLQNLQCVFKHCVLSFKTFEPSFICASASTGTNSFCS